MKSRNHRAARRHAVLGRAVRVFVDQLESRRLLSAGDLDPTFGGGDGRVLDSVGTGGSRAADVVVLADKKILVLGGHSAPQLNHVFLARYNADGTRDTTFGGGTGIVDNVSIGTPGELLVRPTRSTAAPAPTRPTATTGRASSIRSRRWRASSKNQDRNTKARSHEAMRESSALASRLRDFVFQ